MPGNLANSGLGIPPRVKKLVPNQISLIWVWCVFWVIICLIANCFPLFMCFPSQTKLNPPLPNNFIFSNPNGNRSPNVSSSSSVSPYPSSESSSLNDSSYYLSDSFFYIYFSLYLSPELFLTVLTVSFSYTSSIRLFFWKCDSILIWFFFRLMLSSRFFWVDVVITDFRGFAFEVDLRIFSYKFSSLYIWVV